MLGTPMLSEHNPGTQGSALPGSAESSPTVSEPHSTLLTDQASPADPLLSGHPKLSSFSHQHRRSRQSSAPPFGTSTTHGCLQRDFFKQNCYFFLLLNRDAAFSAPCVPMEKRCSQARLSWQLSAAFWGSLRGLGCSLSGQIPAPSCRAASSNATSGSSRDAALGAHRTAQLPLPRPLRAPSHQLSPAHAYNAPALMTSPSLSARSWSSVNGAVCRARPPRARRRPPAPPRPALAAGAGASAEPRRAAAAAGETCGR